MFTPRVYVSQFKGVAWRCGKWVCWFCVNGKRRIVGEFDNEIDAAKTYNDWAVRLYGNKGDLNVI